ncbi:MAG: hypothetical protein DWQ08_00395, partial [Proteobacteria bacterium]
RPRLVPTGRKPPLPQGGETKPRVSVLPKDSESARIALPQPVAGAPRSATGASTAPAPRQSGSMPATTNGAWRWPVQGTVVGAFNQSRGIDIAVSSGTPVKASADGRVVYAGSGLRGYGQLVIVKHSDEYLSAYGHNRKLLVQEGDTIVSGQVIAESGSAPGRGEQVHFEIRRNGKPVDPVRLLPRG